SHRPAECRPGRRRRSWCSRSCRDQSTSAPARLGRRGWHSAAMPRRRSASGHRWSEWTRVRRRRAMQRSPARRRFATCSLAGSYLTSETDAGQERQVRSLAVVHVDHIQITRQTKVGRELPTFLQAHVELVKPGRSALVIATREAADVTFGTVPYLLPARF